MDGELGLEEGQLLAEALEGGETEKEEGEENVRVMVRCRPAQASDGKAVQAACRVREPDRCVEVGGKEGGGQEERRVFHFDAVFGPETGSEQVYMRSARSLVEAAFLGYNCTIFLYGQTGTGKTYTHASLAHHAFAHLFSRIRDSTKRARFLIRASYYELYNEEIRDLLAPTTGGKQKALELRESRARGVYVNGLTCYLVGNQLELERLKRRGDRQRATAATRMNEHSSRSHSILSITIETVEEQAAPVRQGRLNLIDLAGSERQAKSGSSGVQLKEAARINLSLTCLSLVIRALTDPGSSHVPYRNSKLTRLLSSSLGGNSKTLLIACISPAWSSLEETLNTLRFAQRTKRIKNKASINEDAKDALLRKYRRQIEELKLKLSERLTSSKTSDTTDQPNATEELVQQLRLLKGKIMVGGENLLEKVEIHEKLLEASRQELEEKRQEERKLRDRLERKRASLERMSSTRGGLEHEALVLDEKLKRVVELYRRCKEEGRDLGSEHQQLKESLLQTIRATSKGIKYADCIIEDFIPREYCDLINAYAQYDDASDEWQIKYVALSGNNIAQLKRITTLAGAGKPGSGGGGGGGGGGGKSSTASSSSGGGGESGRGGGNNSYIGQHQSPASQRRPDTSSRPDPFIKLKDFVR